MSQIITTVKNIQTKMEIQLYHRISFELNDSIDINSQKLNYSIKMIILQE